MNANEAVTETLREIERQRLDLAGLAARIRQVFGLDKEPGPDLSAEMQRTPRAAEKRKVNTSGLGSRGGMAAYVEKVRTMPEPFEQKHIVTATGAAKGTVSSRTHKWQATGWLKKIGPGQYVRGKNFPGVEPEKERGSVRASERPSVKPTPVLRAQKEKELQEAIRSRDHARLMGREEMTEVFQKDIDRLEAELGE